MLLPGWQAHTAKPPSAAGHAKRQAIGTLVRHSTGASAAVTVPLLQVAALAAATPASSRQADSTAPSMSGEHPFTYCFTCL